MHNKMQAIYNLANSRTKNFLTHLNERCLFSAKGKGLGRGTSFFSQLSLAVRTADEKRFLCIFTDRGTANLQERVTWYPEDLLLQLIVTNFYQNVLMVGTAAG